MKAWQLIEDEKSLCRVNYAVGTDGYFTNPGKVNGVCRAVKWDLQGAIKHCYQGRADLPAIYEAMNNRIYTSINPATRQPYKSLTEFNDTARHSEIIEFLKSFESIY